MATIEFHGADLVVYFNSNPANVAVDHYVVEYKCRTGTVTHKVDQAAHQSEASNGVRSYQDTLTYAENQSAGLTRNVRVSVYAVSDAGRSAADVDDAQNSLPVLPSAPKITGTLTGVEIAISRPVDGDLEGYVAWVGTTAQMPLDASTERYRGAADTFSLQLPDDDTYYLRVAPYDAFGLDTFSAWDAQPIKRGDLNAAVAATGSVKAIEAARVVSEAAIKTNQTEIQATKGAVEKARNDLGAQITETRGVADGAVAAAAKVQTDLTPKIAEAKQAGVDASAQAAQVRTDLVPSISEAKKAGTDAASAAEQVSNDLSNEATRAKNAEGAIVTRVETAQRTADGAVTSISTETTQRVDGDKAVNDRVDSLKSRVIDNYAEVQSQITTLTNADRAAAQRVDTIKTAVDGNTSAIIQNAQASSDRDSGLAVRMDGIATQANTDRGNFNSALQAEQTARSTDIGAVATQANKLATSFAASQRGVLPTDFSGGDADWNRATYGGGSNWVYYEDTRSKNDWSKTDGQVITGVHQPSGYLYLFAKRDPIPVSAGDVVRLYASAGAYGYCPGTVYFDCRDRDNNVVDNSFTSGMTTPAGYINGTIGNQAYATIATEFVVPTGVSFVIPAFTSDARAGGANYSGPLFVRWMKFENANAASRTNARITEEALASTTRDAAITRSVDQAVSQANTDRANNEAAFRDERTTRANDVSAAVVRIGAVEATTKNIATTFTAVSRGNSAPAKFGRGAGIYNADGTNFTGGGRGYRVNVFDASNTLIASNVFDTLEGLFSGGAKPMADFLNNISEGQAVIITTDDEPASNRLTNGLVEAMERCGAGPLFTSPNFGYRGAYILIGQAGIGKGNGDEFYSGTGHSAPDAWIERRFDLLRGRPQLNGAGKAIIETNARVTNEAQASTDRDGALTQSINSAVSQANTDRANLNARVDSEVNTRAGETGTLARRTDGVEARTGSLEGQVGGYRSADIDARVGREETARVNGDNAITVRVNNQEASLNRAAMAGFPVNMRDPTQWSSDEGSDTNGGFGADDRHFIVNGEGFAVFITEPGENVLLTTRASIKPVAGRTYKVSWKVRLFNPPTDGSGYVHPGFFVRKADGSANFLNDNLTWDRFSGDYLNYDNISFSFTATGDIKWMRPRIHLNSVDHANGARFMVAGMTVEDITDMNSVNARVTDQAAASVDRDNANASRSGALEVRMGNAEGFSNAINAKVDTNENASVNRDNAITSRVTNQESKTSYLGDQVSRDFPGFETQSTNWGWETQNNSRNTGASWEPNHVKGAGIAFPPGFGSFLYMDPQGWIKTTPGKRYRAGFWVWQWSAPNGYGGNARVYWEGHNKDHNTGTYLDRSADAPEATDGFYSVIPNGAWHCYATDIQVDDAMVSNANSYWVRPRINIDNAPANAGYVIAGWFFREVTGEYSNAAKISDVNTTLTDKTNSLASRQSTTESNFTSVRNDLNNWNNDRYNQAAAIDTRVGREEVARSNDVSGLATQISNVSARYSGAGNLVTNSDLISLDGWQITSQPAGTSFDRNGGGDYWNISGENSITIGESGIASTHCEIISAPVAVKGGDYVQGYAFAASHRSNNWVSIFFYKHDGSWNGYAGENMSARYNNGGPDLSGWDQTGIKSARVPDGTATMRLALRKYATFNGEAGSIAWFIRPYLGFAREGQNEWNPYSPGSAKAGLNEANARISNVDAASATRDNAITSRVSDAEAKLNGAQDSWIAARVRDEATASVNRDNGIIGRTSSLELSMSRVPQTWMVKAAGNATGRDAGVWSPSGQRFGGYSRSYTVVVFDGNGNVIAANPYDVYGNGDARENMANFLNGITDGQTVIIYTADEPKNGRLDNGNLQNAMARVGAGEKWFASDFRYHSAYILVGRAGIGRGGGNEYYADGGRDTGPLSWLEQPVTLINGFAPLGGNTIATTLRAAAQDETNARISNDNAIVSRTGTLEAQYNGVRNDLNNWNNDRYQQYVQVNARVAAEEVTRSNDVGAAATRLGALEASAVGAGNLLTNTELLNNGQGWTPYNHTGSYDTIGNNMPSADWYPNGENTLSVHQNGRLGSETYYRWYSPSIAVSGGSWYQFYAYCASHRCPVETFIEWHRGDGSVTGYHFSGRVDVADGGRNLNNWTIHGVQSVQAPSDACYALFQFSKYDTNANEGDSWAWFTRPYFGQAKQGQNTWNPFAHGSTRELTSNLLARVSSNEGALVNVQNKVSTAWSEKTVSAGTSAATITMRAVDNNGNATSDVTLAASRIALRNTETGGISKGGMVMSGGNAVFDGSITANGGILVGNGKLKVQVQAQDYAVSHDQRVDFGYDLGRAPTITFGPCPVALNSGEVYAPYATDVSATGFKAQLLIQSAPQSSGQSTGSFSNQGNNTWDGSKSGKPNAANGTYTLTVNLQATAQAYYDNQYQ